MADVNVNLASLTSKTDEKQIVLTIHSKGDHAYAMIPKDKYEYVKSKIIMHHGPDYDRNRDCQC